MVLPVYFLVPQAAVRRQDKIGGDGGWPRSDASLWNNRNITKIRMTCGLVFISIKLKYGNDWGTLFGGGQSIWCEYPPTYTLEYDLSPDEMIIGADATSNSYINSFTLVTNKRTLDFCGSTTGNNSARVQGSRLLYISANTGCYVDGITFHWAS